VENYNNSHVIDYLHGLAYNVHMWIYRLWNQMVSYLCFYELWTELSEILLIFWMYCYRINWFTCLSALKH
jgi:hypothetical protein